MYGLRMWKKDLCKPGKGKRYREGTKTSPYRTINKAAQEARPGDTVVVQKGVYRECVRPARGEPARTKGSLIWLRSRGGSDQGVGADYHLGEGGRQCVESSAEQQEMFGDYNPYVQMHGKRYL